MKTLFLSLIFLVLMGCSIAPNKDRREPIEEISCSGFANWPDCYRKADRLCQNGYEIGTKEENMITQKRTMAITCKSVSR